jgi:hypothetical protein
MFAGFILGLFVATVFFTSQSAQYEDQTYTTT